MLGAVAGFHSDARATPIFNTLLPLLIAFIVGSGGFFFARIAFETYQDQAILLLTGLTVSTFISAFAAGLHFGIDTRLSAARPALTLPEAAPLPIRAVAITRRGN